MSKQNGNKGRRFDRAFKEEAVRLLQTSGRRQRQIAPDRPPRVGGGKDTMRRARFPHTEPVEV